MTHTSVADPVDVFVEMARFLEFSGYDAANLVSMAPLFERRGHEITDRFFGRMLANPMTRHLVDGRVDMLKQRHDAWMRGLFSGDYGAGYLLERTRLGGSYLRSGLPPWFVEAGSSFVRIGGHRLIFQTVEDPAVARAKSASLVKILDLDGMLLNLAYAQERLARLSSMTGLSGDQVEQMISKTETSG